MLCINLSYFVLIVTIVKLFACIKFYSLFIVNRANRFYHSHPIFDFNKMHDFKVAQKSSTNFIISARWRYSGYFSLGRWMSVPAFVDSQSFSFCRGPYCPRTLTHLPSEQDSDGRWFMFLFFSLQNRAPWPCSAGFTFLSRTIQGLSTLFCRLLYHLLSLSLYLSLSLPFSLSLSTYLSPSSFSQLPIHFPSLSHPGAIDLYIQFAVFLLSSFFFLYLILEWASVTSD